jgi:hypothetical protein
MKDLRYDLMGEGLDVDWCWHVEPNPAGTGHHVHAWQRGSFVPQARLSELADGCGMGRVVDVRRWRPRRGPSVAYGLKLAGIGYGLKLAESARELETYLSANGGRLVHNSRGYWRDSSGAACSLRDARSSWAALCADDPGPWVCRLAGEVKREENKERRAASSQVEAVDCESESQA